MLKLDRLQNCRTAIILTMNMSLTVLEKRVVKTVQAVDDMQGCICKFSEGQFQQKNVKISQNAMLCIRDSQIVSRD